MPCTDINVYNPATKLTCNCLKTNPNIDKIIPMMFFPILRVIIDRPRDYTDDLRVYIDHPRDYIDRLRVYIDRLRDYIDRLRVYIDRLSDYTDNLRLYIDRLSDYIDDPRLRSSMHTLGLSMHTLRLPLHRLRLSMISAIVVSVTFFLLINTEGLSWSM